MFLDRNFINIVYTSQFLYNSIAGIQRANHKLDWLQSPVTKYFFLIILFNNN